MPAPTSSRCSWRRSTRPRSRTGRAWWSRSRGGPAMTRRMGVRALGGTLALVLGLVLCGAAVAQTAKDVEKKTTDAWEALKSYTHAKQNEAVAYGNTLMKETDSQIKQLQAKASKASGDARAEYNRQLTALKRKQADASQKLTAMRRATSTSWDAAKQGFADAYQDLRRAYDKAAAPFKS